MGVSGGKPGNTPTVLLLGHRGFVGRAVLALASKDLKLSIPEEPFDLLQPADVAATFERVRPSVVLNLIGVLRGDAERMEQVHVQGTRTLIAQCEAHGARLVSLGSAAEYGRVGDQLVDETAPIAPISAYGETKAIASQNVLESGGCILRPSNIIGPGMRPPMLLGSLLQALHEAQEQFVGMSPHTQRDYIDVRDVARACLAAISKPLAGAFNVGSGLAVSNREACETLVSIADSPIQLRWHDPEVPDAVPVFRMNAAKFQAEADWRPRYTWRQSLADAWAMRQVTP